MLKELFDRVSEAARLATAPAIINYDPHKHAAYRQPDGSISFVEGKPALRSHHAASIEDIAQFARDHEDVGQGVCWYNCDRIVYFPSDADRLDQCLVSLRFAPGFAELKKLSEADRYLDQGALSWSLRTLFKGRYDPGNLLDLIRAVKWDQQNVRQTEVSRGKASIGTAIEKKFAGLMEIPEYVTFTLPLWSGHVAFDAVVKCILEPNEMNGNFLLKPLPDEIDANIVKAEKELGRRLAIALGDDIFLYNGSA